MKLKTVSIEGKNYAALSEDGKPIYVHDDGKEVPFDAPASVGKIRELNNEAKTHREAKEAAEARLGKFEGIEDADAAKAAIETVKNLKEGDLVTAGKVEEIKTAAKRAAEEQVSELRKQLDTRNTELSTENQQLRQGWDSERIGTRFASSKYVNDKLAAPGPLVQKIFGENFKVEDGKIIGQLDGKPIFSRENPGEVADFDEALSYMVDKYSFRDTLIKGSGGGSGGGGGHGGGGNANNKTLTRSEFEGLSPVERSAKMGEGWTIASGD